MVNQRPENAKPRISSGIMPYLLTVFLSAFLLFLVQPLISRYILPWFGGTPSVWSASLLFFQTLLLGGYAFAHWLTTRKSWQLKLYLALFGISILAILISTLFWDSPLLPGDSWKPVNSQVPFFRIIAILLVSIGLPYFLLSTTSPLLQSWFKLFNPERSPYRLYALSNFGSFLGLISYPFIFEPLFGLEVQSWLWFALYLVYVGLCGAIGWKVLANLTPNELAVNTSPPEMRSQDKFSAPTGFRKFIWMALAACTSILLLSITNQLTQEVAVIPFLWVLPLSIYLFSFMLSFSGERWYPQSLLILLLAVATLGVGYALNYLTTTGMFYQILILSLFLLFSTLVCHGELYRLRPESGQLTAFYLYISIGGVVGGLFVNLVAPLVFKGYWELHLGVLLCWSLVCFLQFYNRPSILDGDWFRVAVLPLIVLLSVSSFLFGDHITNIKTGVLEMRRNFYGVIRVRSVGVGDPPESGYSLNHGITAHGFQFRDEGKRTIPTTYYGVQSGIGLALTHYEESLPAGDSGLGINVGLIGLGTGTLAVYGEPGDRYRFYEINPDISALALGEGGYFSYLPDSSADLEIVPGDARISLENELKNGEPGKFDILAVDAFNSDAIPVHLLTVEAVSIYLEHLKPTGVLAIHISNRYLDLAPLVRRLAEHYQLDYARIQNARDETMGTYSATWMLLSKNRDFFRIPAIGYRNRPLSDDDPDIRIWTDDYSNLVPLIKMELFTRIQ